QAITFTNHGLSPVQILPPSNTACGAPNQIVQLQRPIMPGTVSGLQVVENGNGFPILAGDPSLSTVTYACDLDPVSNQPNFQIAKRQLFRNSPAPAAAVLDQRFICPPAGHLIGRGSRFLSETEHLAMHRRYDHELRNR